MRALWRRGSRLGDDALVREYLGALVAAHRSPETVAWYAKVFRSAMWATGGRLPSTAGEVEGWLGSYASPATAKSRLSGFRAFAGWAAKRHGYDARFLEEVMSPATKRARRLPRVFSQGELVAIVATARDVGLREHAAVLTLIDTGIRIGELASIEVADLRPARVTVRGKTGEREVPLSRASYIALQAAAPRAGRVFVGPKGPLLAHSLTNLISGVVRAAGVEGAKVGPHTFRHTFATSYLRNGGSIKRLQMILGHSSVTTTEVYLHLAQVDVEEEHARLSPLRDVLAGGQLQLLRREEAG